MNLNNADAMMIRRLKRMEESWKLARWAAIFVGLLMFSGSAFMFRQIWGTVASDRILVLLCLFIAPTSGIAFIAGLAVISYVFAFWNGRPMNKLLLRLVDEVESCGSS
jgi:uncharacterized membrane protein YgdD (TMEM256/DUF423 family)